MLNSVKPKEETALFELLLYLHEQGAISSTDLISGLITFTVQLEDLRCGLGGGAACSHTHVLSFRWSINP